MTVDPRSRRVLGIDPGTRVAGWGVIEGAGRDLVLVACGVIRAPREASIDVRLRAIFEGAREVLSLHRADLVAVEEAFFGQNARSTIRLGEGRAVAILAAALVGTPVVELAPAVVKKSTAGHGAATKDQVRAAVTAIFGSSSRAKTEGLPQDATDAIALAVAAHARADSPLAPLLGSPRKKSRRSGSRFTEADLARIVDERTRGENAND